MLSSVPHLPFHSSNEHVIGEKKCSQQTMEGFQTSLLLVFSSWGGPLSASRTEDKDVIVQGDKSPAHLKATHQSRPLAGCAPRYPLSAPWGENGSAVKGTERTCQQVESWTKSFQLHVENVFRHFHPSLKTHLNGEESGVCYQIFGKYILHFVKYH